MRDLRAATGFTSAVAPDSVLVALAAVIGFGFAMFPTPILCDGDTYVHLAAGEWMLQHRAVAHVDIFSHTRAGAPWIAHEWLAEVLFAISYRVAGWSGIMIMCGAALSVSFALIMRYLIERLSAAAALSVFAIGIAGTMPSLLARPHLLSMPLLVIWVLSLLSARHESRAPSPLLFPLMTLWANLHGGFAFGLALVLPFAAEALADAPTKHSAVALRWAMFLVAATAAALLTPNGWHGLAFPIQLIQQHGLEDIREWQPPDFSHFPPIELELLALLYVALWRGLRLPMFRLLTLLGLVHLALHHARHEVLASLIGMLLMADPLRESFARTAIEPQAPDATVRAVLSGASAILLLAVLRLTHPFVRTDDPLSPVSALARVPPEIRSLPVLNDYDFGNYLIFSGVRPFIDARIDMYGDEFAAAYFSAVRPDPAKLDRLVTQYQIGWALLRPDSALASRLDSQPQWHRLYKDQFAVVYARDRR